MKVLELLLEQAKIKTDTLRLLFEQDGASTFALTVDGDDALDRWDRLRELAPRSGRWPVLLGVEDLPTKRTVWRNRKEELQTFPHTRQILEEAETIDFAAWLKKRHLRQIQCMRQEAAHYAPDDDSEDATYFRGLLEQEEEFQGLAREAWPEGVEAHPRFTIACRYTHDSALIERPVTMALLPCAHGWQSPAVMKWGDWNSNPKPAMHVAALRFWQQRYGAEIVCFTSDEIEMAVERPPRTREEALRLAKMQYCYCPDIVTQGEGSLDALAARLLNGEAWYFWWD